MAAVTLSSECKFEEFVDPHEINEVVSSKTWRNGEWRKLVKLQDFPDGIHKWVLPVDITKFKILVVSHVVPERHVNSHSHDDDPILRYILSGSFVLNDEKYSSGDWVIVPMGTPYEIFTDEGYTTMAGYGMSCECSNIGGY